MVVNQFLLIGPVSAGVTRWSIGVFIWAKRSSATAVGVAGGVTGMVDVAMGRSCSGPFV
jgi:hypothetical protein